MFFDASDEVLLRRFSETRRPHPLKAKSAGEAVATMDVLEGIHLERERLAPLRARAAMEVDTSQLSVHELRRTIVAYLGPGRAEQRRMEARIVTFGFKYGLRSTPTSSSMSVSWTTRTSCPTCAP